MSLYKELRQILLEEFGFTIDNCEIVCQRINALIEKVQSRQFHMSATTRCELRMGIKRILGELQVDISLIGEVTDRLLEAVLT